MPGFAARPASSQKPCWRGLLHSCWTPSAASFGPAAQTQHESRHRSLQHPNAASRCSAVSCSLLNKCIAEDKLCAGDTILPFQQKS